METIEHLVGKNIRSRRKRLGLSQTQLGEAVGLSVQSINKIETGKRPARRSNLEAIARALGCAVEELYDDRESQQQAPTSVNAVPISPGIVNDGLLLSDVGPIIERLSQVHPARRALILAVLFEEPSLLDGFPDLVPVLQSASSSER